MNTRIKVETKDEITLVKELQKEIELLKKLLLKKDLDAMIEESYLEVAAEKLGYKNVVELKKTKYQALINAKLKSKGFASLTTICTHFGLKRDAFYKFKKRELARLKLEKQIIQILKKRRKSLPRKGVKKMMRSLHQEFDSANLKVGSDILFNILKANHMLTLRKKYSTRATNSLYRFRKYKNIVKAVIVTAPNQNMGM